MAVVCAAAGAVAAQPPAQGLTIVAPAAPGGGWDQTARAMEEALRASGAAPAVRVVNAPGAAGSIGLAQFIDGSRGDGSSLLVGGLVMISALHSYKATLSLLETTPIARLTREDQVVVVPAASEMRTMGDLVESFRADPAKLTWVGGSTGGMGQLGVSLFAQAVGVEPVRVNYLSFATGDEAATALLAREAAAGMSGYGEFAPYIRSGKLRALAIASEARIPDISVPTLREQGIDVTIANWRGVFAPPGIDEGQRQRLIATVDGMVHHPSWKRALTANHWTDAYLAGDAFTAFVRSEQERVSVGYPRPATAPYHRSVLGVLRRNSRSLIMTAAMLASAILVVLLVSRQRTARQREKVLHQDLESAREDARRVADEARKVLEGLTVEIDRQFAAWGLTAAERDVAHLMLKGLRHKEIASLRNTSERTVRQQALAIYKKAGLDGRTDLAAFFLEDLLVRDGKTPHTGAA
jgi:putative tricarboxylic transport membrane protein